MSYFLRSGLPHLFFIGLLCLLYHLSSSPLVLVTAQNTTDPYLFSCTTSSVLNASACAPYINYPIASNTNVSQLLEYVSAYSKWDGVSCPYWFNVGYQCAKYFPPCTNATTPATNATLSLLCVSSCYYAQYDYERGQCSKFSDSYFARECLDYQYYSNNTKTCNAVTFGSSSSDSSQVWKIVLACILGFIGLCIAAYVFIQWWKGRRVSKVLSAEDIERPFEGGPVPPSANFVNPERIYGEKKPHGNPNAIQAEEQRRNQVWMNIQNQGGR